MVSQRLRRLRWILGVVLLLGAAQARAQYPGAPPGGYGAMAAPPGMAAPGYGGTGYGAPGYGGPAYGAPTGYGGAPVAYYMQDGSVIQPVPAEPGVAGPEGYSMDGEYLGEGGYDGEYDGEYYEDGGVARLGDGSILGLLLPYAEGGLCTPRWFDVRVSAVQLSRDKASRRVDFSSLGIAPPNGDPNVVLSTDNFDFDDEWGSRVVVARQIGPGSNIEFNFMGNFNFASYAEVQDPNQGLFSVLSDYGRSPPFGFAETDFATFHSIGYSSAFNSYELMYRRRWQGRNCRLQGSYVAGVRYMQLTEDFDYKTRAAGLPNTLPGFYYMDYSVGTNNSLTGFQFGGDAWVSVIPGFSLGAEAKVGIYGNHSHANTLIMASSIPNGFRETLRSDDAAFIGEINAMAIYRVNYHWTIRAGYDLLLIDGLALATENFNSGQPFVDNPVLAPTRVPAYNDNGQLFLHGWNIGVEYLW